jgi:hypothetical protein
VRKESEHILFLNWKAGPSVKITNCFPDREKKALISSEAKYIYIYIERERESVTSPYSEYLIKYRLTRSI